MKKVAYNAARAMLAAIALSLAPVHSGFAQDAVVPLKNTDVVVNTASGNITQVVDGAIFIKGAGDAHPEGYTITGNTAYVDDQGAPTEKANAKIGHAAVISYVMKGDVRVAMKVTLRNAP